MNAIKQNYFLTSAHLRNAGNILKPKQMNVKISLLPAYKNAGFLLQWGSEVLEQSCAGCGEKIPQMATGGTASSSYSHTVKNSPTMGQKMDRGGVAKWLLPILRFWLLVSLETHPTNWLCSTQVSQLKSMMHVNLNVLQIYGFPCMC